MEKCILPVCSLHTSAARHLQNALGIHDDTVSNGFSSAVIWIFCNHQNKKLKQLSLPTNSKLNSSVVYRCYVKQLRVYSNSFRHANFAVHWFLPRCYCAEQCGLTTFDLRAILQKRDNSRVTSHKMVYKKQFDKIEKVK